MSEKVNNKLERLGEFNFLLAKVEDDGERRVEVFVDCKEGGGERLRGRSQNYDERTSTTIILYKLIFLRSSQSS